MRDWAGTLLHKCFANREFNEGTTELLPDRGAGTAEGTKVSDEAEGLRRS